MTARIPLSASALCGRLEAQTEIINKAIGDARSGKVTDLSQFDKKMAALCEDIETAAPEIARQAERHMAEMINGLEVLAMELQLLQQQLSDKNGDTRPWN